ncbi:hypothetical protein SNE40_010771 [Patella caerulea]|uniref:Uncharacterized protein n=1 Tax=Patella caerulea TaxID=87958 RepID=A0AAN8JWN2_PATCE
MFEEKVKEGFDEARDYLLQFLNIKGQSKESVEIHTGHAAAVSLRTTSSVATTGGHALKSFAVATDATADVLGSITSSAAAAVKATAIAGVVVSAITLPIDLYTIIMNAHDLHSNKKHDLETVLRDFVADMEQNMEDYSKCRGILRIFADEVAKFTDSKIDY